MKATKPLIVIGLSVAVVRLATSLPLLRAADTIRNAFRTPGTDDKAGNADGGLP